MIFALNGQQRSGYSKMLSVEKSTRRPTRGASLIEAAFAVPVILMFSIGIVQAGLMMLAHHSITDLAQIGVRYAMVRSGDTETPATASAIQDFVRNKAKGLDPNSLVITPSWLPDNKQGSSIQVTVEYQYPVAIPFVSKRNLQLRSTARRVIAR